MKINKISLEFTSEELEALSYALELGVGSYKRNKPKCANDWIESAEGIRKRLPTRLKIEEYAKTSESGGKK